MQVFIALDPAQDYEEDQTLWGVADSLAGAISIADAVIRHCETKYARDGKYDRRAEVQLWDGMTPVTVWARYPVVVAPRIDVYNGKPQGEWIREDDATRGLGHFAREEMEGAGQ